MKRTILSLFITLSLSTSATSAQIVIAAWDFSSLSAAPATQSMVPATIGSGMIDLSAFSADSPTERTAFSGAGSENIFAGAESGTGSALALRGSTANGRSLFLGFSMEGQESLALTFATRGTSSGFSSHQWAYSSDGLSYIPHGGNTAVNSGSWTTRTVDFSGVSALNGDPTVWLRLTLGGASSVSGNNRFDNLQLLATPVPEPSEYVLVASVVLLGYAVWRRRRTRPTNLCPVIR